MTRLLCFTTDYPKKPPPQFNRVQKIVQAIPDQIKLLKEKGDLVAMVKIVIPAHHTPFAPLQRALEAVR